MKHVFTTTTHHWMLFFTTKGRVYRVKAHEIPEAGRTARGMYAANLPGITLDGDEKHQRGDRPQGVHARVDSCCSPPGMAS